MVPIGHVLAFAAAVTALTVIPGPAVLFSRALTADRKSALCTVAGNELGAARSIGALFPAVALVLDTAWAAIAGTARQWLSRSPHRLELIGGAGGLVMMGLGISAGATRRNV